MTVRRAASAGLWSTIDIVLRQGVQFVVSVVLARLLVPADFGIIALLSFFSNLSIVFVQGGLGAALIQRQQTSREQESAVFWCNLLASLALALLLVAIAPAVARFYGYPVLAPLMLVAAAQVVFSALGAVQGALLTRALDFRRLAQAGLVASALSGMLGIIAALQGAGVWALGIQIGAAAALNSAAMWWISSWRPMLRFRIGNIRELFGFGLHVGLSNTLDTFYTQGFALLLGKLHGATELGLYNRAAGTQMLPAGTISSIITRIALPLFSTRGSDDEGLRRGVRLAIKVSMLLNMPIMAGIAILSGPLVLVLFGEKWMPAAPLLSILAIAGLMHPLHPINIQVILARGNSSLFLRMELMKKTIGIFCVIVGSLFGVYGLAFSQVLASLFALILNTYFTQRELGYGVIAQMRDLSGIGTATIGMTGAILVVQYLTEIPPLVELMALSLMGAAVYFGLGFAFRLKGFGDSFEVLKTLTSKSAES